MRFKDKFDIKKIIQLLNKIPINSKLKVLLRFLLSSRKLPELMSCRDQKQCTVAGRLTLPSFLLFLEASHFDMPK